jgi:hypothetical protein
MEDIFKKSKKYMERIKRKYEEIIEHIFNNNENIVVICSDCDSFYCIFSTGEKVDWVDRELYGADVLIDFIDNYRETFDTDGYPGIEIFFIRDDAKTVENFLAQFDEDKSSLYKAQIETHGVSWKEIVENWSDYRDPSSGSVNGLIYYSDTNAFAKRYMDELLMIVEEYKDNCGEIEIDMSDSTHFYNWLSWFGWEYMMDEIACFLDL